MLIKLVFGAAVEPGDAVLIGGDAPAPKAAAVERFRLGFNPLHGVGCACCAPRGPAAEALGRLFLARARGVVPWFSRVVVIADDRGVAAVRAALAGDAVTMARFAA
ncbi:MAG: hypothetical protein PHT60_02435 [Acidiphilium sp.]|nr:hypothetical protein [Acidiphilium sp.]MDD4934613.1 hypothetical protein [Acidiphilium sp.]